MIRVVFSSEPWITFFSIVTFVSFVFEFLCFNSNSDSNKFGIPTR
jgi:uncharacterized membrane protein YhaH (DUF805 family)